MSEKEFSLEEALEELNKILDKLEGGEEDIEKSIALYEKGMKLSKKCREHLSELETRVKILAESENGLEEEKFD